MIREAISNFQISPQITENIMREIEHINPTTPSASKPLMPWVVAASSAILITLILGVGSQYLTRYQRPYSLEAEKEMTVELMDTPIVLNLDVKADVQNQVIERADENNVNRNRFQHLDQTQFSDLNADESGEGTDAGKGWMQVNAPSAAGPVWSLSATPDGEVYAVLEDAGICKLPANGESWQQLTPMTGGGYSSYAQLRKWKDTLYFTPGDALLLSTDEGKTWVPIDSPLRISRNYHDFVFTDHAFFLRVGSSIYRSDDRGKSWEEMKIPGVGRLTLIQHLDAMDNTLFASSINGEAQGIYRLDDTDWQFFPLPINAANGEIKSVVVSGNTLYVLFLSHREINSEVNSKLSRKHRETWWIFRSNDKGNSWTDITPDNAWSRIDTPQKITLVAANDTVLAIGMQDVSVARSTNKGDTWSYEKNTGISKKSSRNNVFESIIHATAVNENTFYVGGTSGIHRSIDGGKSWHRFNKGLESRVNSIIGLRIKDKQKKEGPLVLFAITEAQFGAGDLVRSIDGGESWRTVNLDVPIKPDNKASANREIIPRIVSIEESEGILYAKGEAYDDSLRTKMYRISQDGNTLSTVEGLPEFNSKQLYDELNRLQKGFSDSTIDWPPDKSYIEHLQKNYKGAPEFMKAVAMAPGSELLQRGLQGVFAVSDDTFYLEYNYKLYRWKRGEKQWYDTGIEETAEISGKRSWRLHIAVSGETVYVATRNGNIMQSIDGGDVWKDITPQHIKDIDPLLYKPIRHMIFVNRKVYISTLKGVIFSSDGKNWRVLTDNAGDTIAMEILAASASTIYGVSIQNQIYQLNGRSGTWKQIAPNVTANILSFHVDVSSLYVDVSSLYLGTNRNGVLRFDLE